MWRLSRCFSQICINYDIAINHLYWNNCNVFYAIIFPHRKIQCAVFFITIINISKSKWKFCVQIKYTFHPFSDWITERKNISMRAYFTKMHLRYVLLAILAKKPSIFDCFSVWFHYRKELAGKTIFKRKLTCFFFWFIDSNMPNWISPISVCIRDKVKTEIITKAFQKSCILQVFCLKCLNERNPMLNISEWNYSDTLSSFPHEIQ